MNMRLGSGGFAHARAHLPANKPVDHAAGAAEPPAAPAVPTPGCGPSAAPPGRDIVRPSAPSPMAEQLAQADVAARRALANVELLFERAAHGEPLPLAVAEHTVQELLDCLEDDAAALTSLVRLKAHDDYACMHSVAVCVLMASLAQAMRLDAKQRYEAALAGLLHDIGKAFIPARVFAKPGRLTDEEFAVVRSHPKAGFDALDATAGMPAAVKSVARHHHERPDGRGYPDRLSGPRIALLARMGAVCDVYDAVTSNRPYKDGWDPAAAMQAMTRWTHDGQFDPRIAATFKTMMGDHPIGSLVRLRSERLGVVNAGARGRRGGVSVTAFYCLGSQQAVPPEVVEIDATAAAGADAIVATESNAKWRFRGLEELWAGDLAARMQPAPAPFSPPPMTHLRA